MSIIAERMYHRGILLFFFMVNEKLINAKMLKCLDNQIEFQGRNMNSYSQKHTNCHCG